MTPSGSHATRGNPLNRMIARPWGRFLFGAGVIVALVAVFGPTWQTLLSALLVVLISSHTLLRVVSNTSIVARSTAALEAHRSKRDDHGGPQAQGQGSDGPA